MSGCIIPGCPAPVRRNHRCHDHRNVRDDGTNTCPGPGPDGAECGRPIRGRGLCDAHAKQRRRGYELKPIGEARTPKPCTFPGCQGTKYAKGWCRGHYEQQKRGTPLAPLTPKSGPCSFPGCANTSRSRGLCSGHRQQRDRGVPLAPLRASGGSGKKAAAKPKASKPKPKPRAPKPVKALPPLAPWNPNDLKHVDNRPPKPVGGGGEQLAPLAAPDPLPAGLVHALQDRYMATGRADLLAALGIVPGREQIPLEVA